MPDHDRVMAVSAALAPRWDRGLRRRQFPSPQGRAGAEPSPAFALSAPFATVPIEFAILIVIPVSGTVNKEPAIGVSRARLRAGFGLRRALGRADDVTEMMSRSRSAPTRETADRPPRPRSRRSRWTCVCSRERSENLRAVRPIARAIRSRCARQWWTLACRRATSSQSNTRQSGDVSTSTDFRSPHRFGEAAPERVARNG